MGADRLRVLALAIIALALVIASTWFLDWFTFEIHGLIIRARSFDDEVKQLTYVGIGLDDVTACNADGVCQREPLSALPKNFYATLATVTLWTGVAFAAVIAIQAGMRMLSDHASDSISKVGYSIGIIVFGAAFMTAFFFNPEVGSHEISERSVEMAMSIKRTWGPHLLMFGVVIGMFALHTAAHHHSQVTDIGEPPPEPVFPTARALPPRDSIPIPTQPGASQEIPRPTPATVRRDSRPPDRVSGAMIPFPEHLQKKLRYAMTTAEITRGGVDARREDGSTVLVVWRDVVGIVARRMPAAHDSIAFADLVSTAGSTLRLLPWTRLTGDPVEGEDDHRIRSFVELVIARCPEVRVDRATREFVAGTIPPAQLPDVETLAAHDKKLA